MLTLDVFKGDGFSLAEMTDLINHLPHVPGRLGQLGLFQETPVTTTTVQIEEKFGQLALLSPTPRGAPGTTLDKTKRNLRTLAVPHFETQDGIMADEVQGVREEGTTSAVKTVQALVSSRMAEHTLFFDVTLEHLRVGAVKGIVSYNDGSTLNLFTEFGVIQEAEVDFDLDAASPAEGALRKRCDAVVRKIAENLGGVPFSGVHAMCGDNFWDDLVAHKEVRDTYKNWNAAVELRTGTAYSAMLFGGIMWENYRGKVGSTSFFDTDKAHFFPTGVPQLFRTYFAPADYIETVNTLGKPRYAKQYPMPNGKGVHIDMQMNPLNICTRPKVLMKAKRT
ncbi:MAG: major capsid protein [Hyphomicrobiales bacterium]|nr:major capsid protein [Hyphomicrobiales bacterium]